MNYFRTNRGNLLGRKSTKYNLFRNIEAQKEYLYRNSETSLRISSSEASPQIKIISEAELRENLTMIEDLKVLSEKVFTTLFH